jgi:metal-dependent amidase/aminoacylase/carboxypeptidase family protein
METLVRGKTAEAILDANEKVDRALRAGALALGAKVRITTLPAFFPVIKNPDLRELYTSNAISLLGEGKVLPIVPDGHAAGSSDLGDLSCITPIITGFAAGAVGSGHGSDFAIEDYNLAVINPAKIIGMMLINLLADGALKAKEVLSRNKPPMTKQEYLASARQLLYEVEYDQ